jgi:hypothetical protein
MNKIVYTGPTCYLGQWHFTTCKTYDVHLHERSVYYVIADNDIRYYYIIDDGGEISSYPQHCFMDLMLWRSQQIESVLQ